MSIGWMPCSATAAVCAGFSRRCRMPPCTLGCSVFTRPSSISGKPVRSEISLTAMRESRRSLAVPPVEMSSMPRSASCRAKSTRPVLSVTLRMARWILDIGDAQILAGTARLSESRRGLDSRACGTCDFTGCWFSHRLHNAIDLWLGNSGGVRVLLRRENHLEMVLIGIQVNNNFIPVDLWIALLETPVELVRDVENS